MYVLGVCGSLESIDSIRFSTPRSTGHDAAAVLLKDGEIIAAVEEERFNRIKHTNKIARSAINFCLKLANITFNEISAIGFYGKEESYLNWLRQRGDTLPTSLQNLSPKEILAKIYKENFNETLPLEKFYFVPHQLAHAWSTFGVSGFSESLVVSLDAQGDEFDCGMVLKGTGVTLDVIHTLSHTRSLGGLYRRVCEVLGFEFFDEYKVMGLAPYGNPSRFRKEVSELFHLCEDGDWTIDFNAIPGLSRLLEPKSFSEKGERVLSQSHKDLAASLQETLEILVFHLLRHWQAKIPSRNLCLAGGVAQNCVMNGKILRSGMFDRVFVQPASHDAGCALGAALSLHFELSQKSTLSALPKLPHVYFGKAVTDDPSSLFANWQDFIEFRRSENIVAETANLLAAGEVIAWVQGRAEFGPRALGNRSILADPRPASNRDYINALVKKREAFRPFAPSITEEAVHDFFDLPENFSSTAECYSSSFPFMIFTLPVKKERRELLGAVTHVDGSARLQTVSRSENLRFWELLREFGMRTGIPILLNTSFNNFAEPIVNTEEDAIICLLTTGLKTLVVGDFIIRKKQFSIEQLLQLELHLFPYYPFVRNASEGSAEFISTFDKKFRVPVSRDLSHVLESFLPGYTLGEACQKTICEIRCSQETVAKEVFDLWERRVVQLRAREVRQR